MKHNHNPIISTVTITYNSSQEIVPCIDALVNPADPRVQVIVLDNQSSDNTRTILKERYQNNPFVTLVYNQENVGFAKGCNQGSRLATGNYLVLLNPDTIAPLSELLTLAHYLDTHPNVGVVGPRIVDEFGVAQETFGKTLTPWNEFVGKIFYSKYMEKIPWIKTWKKKSLNRNEIIKVGWIGGACMMIRKELYDMIGGIDEHFFLSHGDMVDLGIRVKQQGYSCVLMPQCTIVHTGSKSVASDRDRALYEAYSGTLYFFKKHYGPITVVMVKMVYIITSLAKACVAGIVGIFKKNPYRAIAFAHANNAWKLILGKIN